MTKKVKISKKLSKLVNKYKEMGYSYLETRHFYNCIEPIKMNQNSYIKGVINDAIEEMGMTRTTAKSYGLDHIFHGNTGIVILK